MSLHSFFNRRPDLRRPRVRRSFRRSRRGIILLVALGVLIIFSLVVVMFVLTARQHKAASLAYQRVERYDDNFEELLERAMMQILRGSNNAYSSIAHHSLLEDMYGNDALPALHDDPRTPLVEDAPLLIRSAAAIRATIAGGANVQSGLLQIVAVDERLNRRNGYYNGRLLSVLNGPARMQSTRIVGYNWSNDIGTFQVMAFENGRVPSPENSIHINGREFNGAGFGFDPKTGLTSHPDPETDFPGGAAFFQNRAAFVVKRTNHPNYTDPAGPGGADEGYDAPDYNNMHLAGRFWNSANGRWEVLIPSFHRPALINYFAKHSNNRIRFLANFRAKDLATQDARDAAAFQRKYILRPSQAMNSAPGRPAFDGSNQFLTSNIVNPDRGDGVPAIMWDVDNDGDGLVDSIWVDLGMPVQTAPDGRQFKPLFAIMVLDMDSRLNLNVHGSPAHVQAPGPSTRSGPYAGGNSAYLPPGQGNSVAAVNLRTILSNVELRRLFGEFAVAGENGRYGERDQSQPKPGKTDDRRDAKDIVNHPHYLPVDLAEQSQMGLDKHGQPIRWFSGSMSTRIEHPLHMNPYVERFLASSGRKTAIDSPLTMADLEGIPRRFDVDAQSLSPRLRNLLPGLWDATTRAGRLRQGIVTAESYDPPVFSAIPSPEMREAMIANRFPPTGNHILDLIAFRILLNSQARSAPRPNAALIRRSFELLLPPELVRGERMDVNRPFGNGRDDSLLFGVPPPTQLVLDDLDKMEINLKLRQAFTNNGRPLSGTEQVTVITVSREWKVDDYTKIYFVKYENNTLNIYDIGKGIVDEQSEIDRGRDKVWWNTFADLNNEYGAATAARYATFAGVPLDYDNDGVRTPSDLQARQTFARYLYVMMMAMMDSGYRFPINPGELDPADPAFQAQRRYYTAQRVAQWAVNVVDFRDPDSIHTPFEFDYEPFVDNDQNPANGTWDVDGWIGVPPGAANIPDDTEVYRGLVWGVERPQLLLTESFAPHDISTEDRDDEIVAGGLQGSKIDPTGIDPNADKDLDQRRRPQGSLFIELHNPWLEPVPAELRSLVLGSNINAVDLSRLAPASNDAGLTREQRRRRPVWQLVITGPDPLANNPDLGHLDPRYPDADLAGRPVAPGPAPGAGGGRPDSPPGLSKKPPTPPGLSKGKGDGLRIVWFTSNAAYAVGDPKFKASDRIDQEVDKRIYYTRLADWNGATPDLQRPDFSGWENKVGFNSSATNQARMCLVRPGRYSVIGPRVKTRIGLSGDPNADPKKNLHTIRLLDDTFGRPIPPRNLAANGNARGRLVSDTGTPGNRVINYPNWDPDTSPSAPPADAARGGDASIKYPRGIVINFPRPLSVSEPGPGDDPYPTPDALTEDPDDASIKYRDAYSRVFDVPLDPLEWRKRGTRERFATVYLQRLANPLIAWHPDSNPYLSVDYMPIDLTVFNGEYAGRDPDDLNPQPKYFSSRERIGDRGDFNIWKQSFSSPVEANQRHQRNFSHSLGFLSGLKRNRYFAPNGVWTRNDFTGGARFWNASDYGVGGPYVGDPRRQTFPWLTWNDHPFASHLELMNVPASSPSKFLLEYHLRRSGAESFFGHYRDRSPAADRHGPHSGPPFGHLLNFFLSGTGQSNFYRALEYLQVPSRFDGAQKILNPRVFQGNRLIDPLTNKSMSHSFHPPFNRISRYRAPGRININMIFDDGTTLAAILNNDFRLTNGVTRNADFWRKVFLSRQGYIPDSINPPINPLNQPLLPHFNNSSPTFFANPFRPYSTSNNTLVGGGAGGSFVDATLLRRDPFDPNRPLMSIRTRTDDNELNKQFGPQPDADTRFLGAGEGRAAYRDGDRSPYFRYETLKKLGNVLTTRSNVYAVWITVGFFEVTPVLDKLDPSKRPARALFSDGYALGQEMGTDTGEIVRHRMFCVFDRTIPVAFRRGENYNVRKAIVLKKVIE